jgi:hypothetical protein
LTDDGDIEINGRDVREKAPTMGQRDLFEAGGGERLS